MQALASTVKTDPTAPHYKYHDDPYLTPISNVAKRSFALSKESGRKAAQWIRAQNPELFQHKVAFPPVQVISYFLGGHIYMFALSLAYS
jgi:pentatricopeptide repeat domain-containing protein 3